MKQLFIIILLLACILFLDSCTVTHPWDKLNVPKNSDFEVLEDLSCGYNMPGVRVWRVREGDHQLIVTDIGFDIETRHDSKCPNPVHGNRLVERAKENELRREGF